MVMGLGCRTIGIVGWVVLGSILPLRSLGLNPMPKQLIKNIRRGETPQKRAETLGKNAFEVFWKERNCFFKELIQTEEPTTEQTDIPEPSLSDLYKTALKKSFSYLEGIYGQPLPAEQHDELFNAVLEQILPFVNAIHRMDAFLAPFTNNPQEVFERLKTIATDYQNALSIDERDIYGPSFRQFYYKINLEGGAFNRSDKVAARTNFFAMPENFLPRHTVRFTKRIRKFQPQSTVLFLVSQLKSYSPSLHAMVFCGRYSVNSGKTTRKALKTLSANCH